MYVWLLGFHIVAVIAWMAGMLYLPRLYVYHTRASPGSEMDVTFKEMERKLLRVIMNPAMVVVAALGLSLIYVDAQSRGWRFLLTPWMLTKLTGVAFMFGWHGYLAAARRRFEAGANVRSERYWRMVNELPAVTMIVMVLAVTTKLGD